MGQILVVEDDSRFGSRLCKNLEMAGHRATLVDGGVAALAYLQEHKVDLVLTDVVMPEMDGLELLRQIRSGANHTIEARLPVVLLTSVERVDIAVEAMRAGAQDYITKDSNRDAILFRLERVLETAGLQRRADILEQTLQSVSPLEEIVAQSSVMRSILSEMKEIAAADANVLITGETGVGKELVARHLHRLGRRSKQALIDVNCAALPTDNLFQSEVFGHERGAFTGATERKKGKLELADGGILFLDEIGDMPPESQGKILRALDTQAFERLGGSQRITVDIVVMAATNKNLQQEAEAGRFRKDLLFRLDVLQLHVPPLRERRDDIFPLAQYYLKQCAGRRGRPAPELTPDAAEALVQYDWPGNVRELINVVERLVLRHRTDGPLTLAAVRKEGIEDSTGESASGSGQVFSLPPNGMALEELERQAIVQALEQTDWIQSAAAKLLRISPDRMNARVKKFNITHPSWRSHKSS